MSHITLAHGGTGASTALARTGGDDGSATYAETVRRALPDVVQGQ
ncbi:hypothetical protein [Actinosynnema sp. ALI-1.44]|nr:hypothetical protein [Actinosynnema sp. ALI-1.44]